MSHIGEGPELLLEPENRLGINTLDGLEGHRHCTLFVERPIDNPHAAAAQLVLDAIATQPLPAKGACGRLGGAIESMAWVAIPRPRRFPVRELGQQLQHLLAGVAIFHVHHQLIARGLNKALGQQELELLAVGACHHWVPSNFRTSSRIINLTSLLAT